VKKIIFYIILYIIFCLLQFSFGKYINICGIYPNFILILIIYLGFSRGSVNAQLFGFLFGLTWDVLSIDIFGVRAILFVIIGYLVGMFSKSFDGSKVITQFVLVLFGSIIYWLGLTFIYYILSGTFSFTFSLISLSGPMKVIATVSIAPAVFYVLDRVYKDI
jgi:rod shape-determining protein MreD